MPADVARHTFTFLRRSWWPDERASCWRYECQHGDLKNIICSDIKCITCATSADKASKSITMIPCPGCGIAHACSNKHLNAVFREGHRRVCQTPPLRPFNSDDEALCREVLGEHLQSEIVNSSMDEVDIDSNDEDSCWESIASDVDSNEFEAMTDVIFRFFDSKRYQIVDDPVS